MKSSINIQAWTPSDFPNRSFQETGETTEVSELERIYLIFGRTGLSDNSAAQSDQRGYDFRNAVLWEPGDVTQLVMEKETISMAGSSGNGFNLSATAEKPLKPIQRREPQAQPSSSREVEDAHLQAERIVAERLAEAKKEADQIVQQAVLKRDEIYKKAYDEGYAEGIAQIDSAVQAAKTMLEQFASWRQEMIANSEQDILGLVKEIAQVLFGDGFALDASALQATFSRILLSARALGDLRLYVNPEDAKLLDPAWREYQVLISGQRIQVLPTEAIRRGGCYLEGQRGSVDARIEHQLRALLNDGFAGEDESMEDGAA